MLAIGTSIIGLLHIIATYTPVIAGKLTTLDSSVQHAFLYMSLMCGALLILGGIVTKFLNKYVDEYKFLKSPLIITLVVLAIDGILAPCFMPKNPCSWAVFLLTLPMLLINIKRK
ncbi:MAG: hypothetical protein MJ211_14895 [Bacteroidales bacterium]|nr:hypothetical protein [Bacteroidales bacterium]